MNLTAPAHPIERVAIAVAGSSLGAATAFATIKLAPLAGLPLMSASLAAGAAMAGVGLMLLRWVGGPPATAQELEPIDFVKILAEDPLEYDELLLDEPVVPEQESRVVQLFGAHQPPEPLPEPGELVTRIATYLDSGRGAPRAPAEPIPMRADATAALHAALADIRRSLG